MEVVEVFRLQVRVGWDGVGDVTADDDKPVHKELRVLVSMVRSDHWPLRFGLARQMHAIEENI